MLYFLNFIFMLILLCSTLFSNIPKIKINEILTSNASINFDPDFYSFSDWIEIKNLEDTTVNLGGYFITDDFLIPNKYVFPDNYLINPNSYVVIWADDMDTVLTSLHTNFKLSRSGEEIGIYNFNGELVDSLVFEDQITDISYGKKNDESSNWVYFYNPTPYDTNFTIGYQNNLRSSIPRFNIPGGVYNVSQTITLDFDDIESVIYYTTDGSKPNVESQVYNQPLFIDSTTIIRSLSVKEGLIPSKINTDSYIINHQSSMPVISISTDSSYLWDSDYGIYVPGNDYQGGEDLNANYMQDWERPIHIEIFNTQLLPTATIKLNAGMKIYGGFSRNFPQKSLGIYFRNKYDLGFIDNQIFSDKSIAMKRIVLRNGGNDWNHSMLLDGLFTKIIEGGMDIDYQAYRPSILYLNGSYMGIHNIREKIDEHYIESNFGIDKDDIDMLENNPHINDIGIIQGSKDDFVELLNYISNNNIIQNTHYDYVGSKIDIDQYINYQICELFFANGDWPMNNQKYWKSKEENSRWRWILYDLEYMIVKKNIEFDIISHAINQDTNYYDFRFLFRELLKNEQFKSKFLQRSFHLINTIFHPLRTTQIFDEIKETLEDEIDSHSNRWKYECFEREHWNPAQSIYCGMQSLEDWESELIFINDFLVSRGNYLKANIMDYFVILDSCIVNIESNIEGAGSLSIAGTNLDTSAYNGRFFKDIHLLISVIENPGYNFLGWEGINQELINNDSISVLLSEDINLTAVFETALSSKNEDNFPHHFNLKQNWPNPFNSTTKISYDLPNESFVTLLIYDLMGRKVRTLINSEQTIGFKNIQWNATNDNGQTVPAGMYIYTIQAGKLRQTRKMVLLK